MKHLQKNNPTIGAQEFPLVDKASEDIYIYKQPEFLPKVEISLNLDNDTRYLIKGTSLNSTVYLRDLANISIRTKDGKYTQELSVVDNYYPIHPSENYCSSEDKDYPMYFPFSVIFEGDIVFEVINDSEITYKRLGGNPAWTDFKMVSGGTKYGYRYGLPYNPSEVNLKTTRYSDSTLISINLVN